MYLNHGAPRTKLDVPKDYFLVPLNHTDVRRHTKASLDVLQEATNDDHWNMDGDESLSELWIGVTRFALLDGNQPEGDMWVQVRLTKKQQVHQSQHNHGFMDQANHGEVISNIIGGDTRKTYQDLRDPSECYTWRWLP